MSNAAETNPVTPVPMFVDLVVRTLLHDEYDLVLRVLRREAINMSTIVRALGDAGAEHATFYLKNEPKHVELRDLVLPERDEKDPHWFVLPHRRHARVRTSIELNAKSIPEKFDHCELRVYPTGKIFLAVGHEDCGPYWNESTGFVAGINDLLRHFQYKTLKGFR